jgi:VanZ family protein
MAFIFVLSSIQRPPATPAGTDKLLHTLLYAGLGVLIGRAIAGGVTRLTWSTVVQAAMWGGLYGVSDELHQYFNPPRAVEILDVLADTVGSALGASALYWWGIIRPRNGV